MKFGENLKKLRKLQKLSQEELAEKVGVSRQSVSKWECGEAYPEMNHILKLCKIFHCHMNDLVNDHITDIDLLDDEVKQNVVKFKKEQQRKMKGLSKAIMMISKICRMIVLICIPIILISMIALVFLIQRVDVVDGGIVFHSENEKIRIVEVEDRISLEVDGRVVADTNNQQEIAKVKEIFENHSKPVILGYVETGFVFLIISFIFISIMLKSLESLFRNIHEGDTPFTLENVRYIQTIAYLMIAVTVLPNVVGLLFEQILRMDLEVEFELLNLVEILFLFSIAYIFQYGYEIQLDSKGKMYGDE